ncbi:DUF2726 domain-containing protein [Pseudoalteromonas denitrificans]|uniref:DUF2726 domain-containing protein n=1 Tax=Pseudoalteromonas denitrificans DSM 6059 TaxID=1123010 RepID=A0A1I1PZ68_9GAMM|nr:DUF2726 domain-containing protein [Pseudoalteromonas denitrificans]SFD11210.1 Protein of unknown function [Pseudoalteromonas denitrificans DSM 6059]
MEFVLLSILVLVVIASMVASKLTDSGNPYPFTKKNNIYTQVEKGFLTLLERAIGNDYKVVSRVMLIDIIDFKSGITSKSKRIALTKAKNKQLDYVLLDKETMNIVAAIDLVNNNNKQGHKAQKDWFVNGALESAGIPHIRMKVKAGYKPLEVRQAIMFKLGKTMPKKPLIKARTSSKPAVLSPSQIKTPSTGLVQA